MTPVVTAIVITVIVCFTLVVCVGMICDTIKTGYKGGEEDKDAG